MQPQIFTSILTLHFMVVGKIWKLWPKIYSTYFSLVHVINFTFAIMSVYFTPSFTVVCFRSYARRAFQCNQRSNWMTFVILHQLTLDLMGIEENAFAPYSNATTEDSYFARCVEDNALSLCRLICCKKKYGAFFQGDLDAAAKVYEQSQDFPIGSTAPS
mmetsp:Transcript_28890/g.52809  ORF Transcript_28890/g.52809 Transcript_28890/m.52809 type:complete len:159 (-) Transcript_28890:708-1184(-)